MFFFWLNKTRVMRNTENLCEIDIMSASKGGKLWYSYTFTVLLKIRHHKYTFPPLEDNMLKEILIHSKITLCMLLSGDCIMGWLGPMFGGIPGSFFSIIWFELSKFDIGSPFIMFILLPPSKFGLLGIWSPFIIIELSKLLDWSSFIIIFGGPDGFPYRI